jgi:hypothetical protein
MVLLFRKWIQFGMHIKHAVHIEKPINWIIRQISARIQLPQDLIPTMRLWDIIPKKITQIPIIPIYLHSFPQPPG